MTPKLEGFSPLLQVFDMPRSIAFYRDVLGFEVVDHSPERATDDFDWAMLSFDEITLMLNTTFESDQRPQALSAVHYDVHKDVSLYFGCRDLESAYAWLQKKGVPAEEPRAAPYGMSQLYLKDPDGYVICLQWPSSVD